MHLREMVETEAVNLLETTSQETAKAEKNTAYKAIECVARQVVVRGTASIVIQMKVNSFAESRDPIDPSCEI